MGRPKRLVMSAAAETINPPDEIAEHQAIARVVKATGNNIYAVELASGKSLLVELPSRFRSTIWIRRGGYVLVDTKSLADRNNKLDGEIMNVVMHEKEWRKMSYWPTEFTKRAGIEEETKPDESLTEDLPSQGSEDES